jgi:hypothetical protein
MMLAARYITVERNTVADVDCHQSLSITTKVVSSATVHGEVYLIQHNVIKCVSDPRKVDGFLRILRFPPSTKPIITVPYNGQEVNSLTTLYLTVLLRFNSGTGHRC